MKIVSPSLKKEIKNCFVFFKKKWKKNPDFRLWTALVTGDFFSCSLQPNLETRKKQIDAWCSLVLSYHRHHRVYKLDVVEAQNSALFHNKAIARKLTPDAIYVILDELRKRGKLAESSSGYA